MNEPQRIDNRCAAFNHTDRGCIGERSARMSRNYRKAETACDRLEDQRDLIDEAMLRQREQARMPGK